MVRRLLRLAIVVRVILLHLVIYVAVEFEMLDSVIPVKDAEQRVLVVRIRRRMDVKLSDTAEVSWNVEFRALARLPRAPASTIFFFFFDLERDCGGFRLRLVNAYPPASLGCLGVRRRSADAHKCSEKRYCDY